MAESTIKQTKQEHLFEITTLEREHWSRGELVAGMDEVGRGPLAGPVTVACVIMPKSPLIERVNDSKKLSEKRRELLYPLLIQNALDYNVASIPPNIIDDINILEATRLGFELAFHGMSTRAHYVLCDYISGLHLDTCHIPLVHGDALSYTIGAASIIAKVERDRYMIEIDKLYPQYGFAKNKGYGTPEHIAALIEYGACPIHRKSFVKTVLDKAKHKSVLGKHGEIIAKNYLLARGFELILSNYRAGHGEIDLIMRDKDTIVFIEVKARSSTQFGTGLDAITTKKCANLIDCANHYCAQNNLFDSHLRFDAVEVDLNANSVSRYVANAFGEN